MLRMMKALAGTTPFNASSSRNATFQEISFTGAGVQFSRTPSMINTFFVAAL